MTPKNGMEEMAQNPAHVQFERGCLIRRLRGLGVQPITGPMIPTSFFWDLLRYVERGGQ